MIPLPKDDDPKVKWRRVVNDAVVGEWTDLPFPVFPPTLEGLKVALSRPEQRASDWNPALLEYPGGFDPHLVNYGLRLQFRISLPEEVPVLVAADELAKSLPEIEQVLEESCPV